MVASSFGSAAFQSAAVVVISTQGAAGSKRRCFGMSISLRPIASNLNRVMRDNVHGHPAASD